MGVRVLCMRKVVLSFFLVSLSFTSFACGSEEEGLSGRYTSYTMSTRAWTAITTTTSPSIFKWSSSGPHSFSTAQLRDLDARCDEAGGLEKWDCYKMVDAATINWDRQLGVEMTIFRECSYEEVKTWIAQEKYLTNFWLFIENNCGTISPTIS